MPEMKPAQKWKRRWFRFILKIMHLTLSQQLVLSGTLVGTAAGVTAYVFDILIHFLTQFSLDQVVGLKPVPKAFAFIFFPAFGGLLAGLLTHSYYPEAKGHGVFEVVRAIREQGGYIRGRMAWIKLLASASTIGFGGSAGREGPIVQIGAAVGSWIGRRLNVSTENLKMLVAGGAVGGLAASFSIPLAGVFFTMEVILRNFASGYFPAVVIASVTGTAVARILIGKEGFFTALHYEWTSVVELLYHAPLGLICAFLGIWYIRSLKSFENYFANVERIPGWLKPAIGGGLVGALALAMPGVLGTGQGVINGVLQGNTFGWMMVALVFGKILATCLTLGSGGSGGALMPALFIGAMAGGAWGELVMYLIPGAPNQPGIFAVVGMACVFAASFQAPVTAMMMAFELTRDYGILPLVMFTCVITSLATNKLIGKRLVEEKG